MRTAHGIEYRKQTRPVGDVTLPPSANLIDSHWERILDTFRSLGMPPYSQLCLEYCWGDVL